jgi:hypothetical protein
MNKGTKEGTFEEENFVRLLNKKEILEFWEIFGLDPKNHYAVRVIHKKFGKVNNEKILPKADVFIVKGEIDEEFLKNKEYLLDEDDIESFNVQKVNNSGISVKRPDSKKYQIVKMSPSTFKKIFGSNILAAGASIYCSREEEFFKNKNILDGWGVEEKSFIEFFKKELNIKSDALSDLTKNDFERIKKYSNDKIREIIKNNKNISDLLFFGKGNFEEPYTAEWIYEKGVLKKNYVIPFTVTTGSGRSKGKYTIVLKPK